MAVERALNKHVIMLVAARNMMRFEIKFYVRLESEGGGGGWSRGCDVFFFKEKKR